MIKGLKRCLACIMCVTLFASCTPANNTQTATDEVTIYLVRHGKTWFNTTGQVQGFADSPLTESGIEGAKKAGKALSDVAFENVYTGDLSRQRNTAKYIIEENSTKKDVPFKEHIGFQEWNYGGFEGKTNSEMWTPIMSKYNLSFDEDWSDYAELVEILGDGGIADAIAAADPLKEAENYNEITLRGKEALDTIIAENKTGNVLVVSSGSMIPTLLEIALPGEYQGESISNSSITILKYKDGKYRIETIGDTSHL